MKIFSSLLLILLLLPLSGCGDDFPPEVSEKDVLGIWTDGTGAYLEIEDTNYIYSYTLQNFQGEDFWIKRRLSYLYEPVSSMMLAQDNDGILQLYKVSEPTSDEMVLCWVETPMQEELQGDARFEIIRVFFNKDYEEDPANNVYYTRLTESQLQEALGDTEVIDFF